MNYMKGTEFVRASLYVEKSVMEDFKTICEANGLKINMAIRILMRRYVKENKAIVEAEMGV